MRTNFSWTVFALSLVLGAFGCTSAVDSGVEAPTDPPAGVICGGAAELDAVWDEAARGGLREAMVQVPGEWPMTAVALLEARVDQKGPTWRRAYADACAQEDLRAQRCLDQELWELAAVVELVAGGARPWPGEAGGERGEGGEGGEAAALERVGLRAAGLWRELDGALGGADACRELGDPLFDAPPLPREVGVELVQVRLLSGLGELEVAGAIADALASTSAVVDEPAYAFMQRSQALELELRGADRGSAQAVAGELAGLRAAMDVGGPLEGSDRAGARVAQLEALSPLEALRAGAGADASAERLAALERSLEFARAVDQEAVILEALTRLSEAHAAAGAHGPAVSALTEAISLSARMGDGDSPHSAALQRELARSFWARGEVGGALDLLLQTRDGFAAVLGPDHPETLAVLVDMGRLFLDSGRPLDAQYAFLDLLDIYDTLYGPKHPATAGIKLELADALGAMGEVEGALELYRGALTPLTQALGAEHPTVIRAVVHLGRAEIRGGELESAAKQCATGQGLAKALPPDHPLVAEAQQCVEELGAAQAKARRRRPRRG